MKTLPTRMFFLKKLLAAALLAPFFCPADDAEKTDWHDPVMIQRGDNDFELLTPEESVEYREKQKEREEAAKKKPDPGWIGDCYYYADGGYYHKDGVYWRPDLKTHYVYAEECWHLANGGILTGTGVYYPSIAAPDGLLGVPWRLAAVVTALVAGPPDDPGAPPPKPTQVVIEVRSSSDR